jgi:hypothetical protein
MSAGIIVPRLMAGSEVHDVKGQLRCCIRSDFRRPDTPCLREPLRDEPAVAVPPIVLEAEQDDVVTCTHALKVPQHGIRVEVCEAVLPVAAPVHVPVLYFEQFSRGSEREVAGAGVLIRREAGDRDGYGCSGALCETAGKEHNLVSDAGCKIPCGAGIYVFSEHALFPLSCCAGFLEIFSGFYTVLILLTYRNGGSMPVLL